ncbi:MAG: hypothetical protein P8N51_03520, partial [Pseudomonadales bacterium]|nr:hypothetical protein [Pseudomonadales bacterium]
MDVNPKEPNIDKKKEKKTVKKKAPKQKTPTKQKRSRAETERRLIDVALELIRDNGVLAGLNLRQVAEGARVNR